MHVTVQSSGHSPRQVSGSSMKSQLKPVSDSMQNNSTFPAQSKGKKRERGDMGFEPTKRERTSRIDDMDFGHSRFENILKADITNITDKGGLVDIECVKNLVQLIQDESGDRKIDLACRSLLIGVIAATDNMQCLSEFVQLRGLLVLDEWLQEAHKRKGDDGTRSRDSEKSIEDFLLVLLRALDKLPVNLNALQTCNIGKSVNHLRTHKNAEIQKKARILVDTWKKRVEAEMNGDDTKHSSGKAVVSWPSRSRQAEISHAGNRISVASTETALRSSIIQPCRSSSVISLQGDPVKSASIGPRLLSAPASMNFKEGQPRVAAGSNISDHPHAMSKDEKSSCCSVSVSASGRKLPDATSRHHRLANNLPGSVSVSGVQREAASGRTCLLKGSVEKVLQSATPSEKPMGFPISEGSIQKFIVKLPSQDRSPVGSASRGSLDDHCIEKCEDFEQVSKEKSDVCHTNINADENTESWHSNDLKDVVSGSDEGSESPIDVGRLRRVEEVGKVAGATMAAASLEGDELKSILMPEASLKSLNSLVEKQTSPVDDIGMRLLASVAAGEMPMSESVSDSGNKSVRDEDSHPADDLKNDQAVKIPESTHMDVGKNYATSERVASSTPELPAHVSCPELHNNFEFPCIEKKASIEEGLQYCEKSVDEADIGGNNVETNEISVKKGDMYALAVDKTNICGGEEVEGVSSSYFTLETEGDKTSDIKECMDTCQPSIPEEPTKNKIEMDVEMSSGHSSYEDEKRCEQLRACPDPNDPDSNDSGEDEDISEKHLDDSGSKGGLHLSYAGKVDEVEECTSTVADAPMLPVTKDLGIDERMEFDLNEGLSTDEGKYVESINLVPSGCYPSSNLINPLPLPFSLPYTGISPCVTVAAAAKGSFFPPDTLLRGKGELGWKGSAATSAFRPAEPRKVIGIHANMNNLPLSDANIEKHDRSPLEIDLNIPDERILEDMSSQHLNEQQGSKFASSQHFNEQEGSKFASFKVLAHGYTPGRPSGGVILDLNSVDEATEFGQCSTSKTLRMEPLLPAKPSSSSGYLKLETSCRNEIDLNNGPRADETIFEPTLLSHLGRTSIPSQSTIACLKMSNAEIGNYSSSIPSGPPTYSTVTHPALLSDRGEHSIPLLPSGPPRMLTPHGNMPFPSNTLQYPIFPFGTSFPIPPTTFSVASTGYIDSSAGNFCFPGVHTPILARSVSSQFPRPYGIGATEVCSTNAEVVNMKWCRQGLDLNAGPGALEAEIKDETVPLNLRHLPANASQFLVEEQARMYKAADNALKSDMVLWEGERFNYRPSSWQ